MANDLSAQGILQKQKPSFPNVALGQDEKTDLPRDSVVGRSLIAFLTTRPQSPFSSNKPEGYRYSA
jgi:hypothetical protein